MKHVFEFTDSELHALDEAVHIAHAFSVLSAYMHSDDYTSFNRAVEFNLLNHKLINECVEVDD